MWFDSPRRACVAAIRLMVLVRGATFKIPSSGDVGAEGPVTMVIGTIPNAQVAHADRLLEVLAVPVTWDERPAA